MYLGVKAFSLYVRVRVRTRCVYVYVCMHAAATRGKEVVASVVLNRFVSMHQTPAQSSDEIEMM